MNTKTIITSLGLMGLSCTAQAASSDPWNYYKWEGIIVPHIQHGMIPILE